MLFWILAAIVLALATLIACLPLFRQKTGWTPIALALVFALPAGALMLYQEVGTPQALDIVGAPQTSVANSHQGDPANNAEIDDLVSSLRSRLSEDTASLEGWVLLARTLKTMQRYPEALDALETARRIAPDDPFVTVELVEARIFVSRQGLIDQESVALLQGALTADPSQQKALWLLGIAATQAGEDEAAISYWETLLQELEADSPAAQSVQDQIATAQNRLGQATETRDQSADLQPAETITAPPVVPAAAQEPAEASESGSWAGLDVHVSGGNESQTELPASAVLYVMIRSPGPAVGPPIGVRRIRNPVLPVEVSISDRDSMLQERQISSQTEIQLQARLSMTGAPQAMSGDWQSNPLTISLKSTESLELVIDQQVK